MRWRDIDRESTRAAAIPATASIDKPRTSASHRAGKRACALDGGAQLRAESASNALDQFPALGHRTRAISLTAKLGGRMTYNKSELGVRLRRVLSRLYGRPVDVSELDRVSRMQQHRTLRLKSTTTLMPYAAAKR